MNKMSGSGYMQHDHGLSQDAQGRWWEILSPTQVPPGDAPQVQATIAKCRGNRKLQHFKRKCRRRGMSEEEIMALIQTRTATTSGNQTEQAQKRKRDETDQQSINSSTTSLSQLSISQPSAKKMKDELQPQHLLAPNDTTPDHTNMYKPSKYLRMPRQQLLRSLRLQLNFVMRKKKHQRFVLARLHLLDEKFCLNEHRYLHQTYLDLGTQYDLWPVSMEVVAFVHLSYANLYCRMRFKSYCHQVTKWLSNDIFETTLDHYSAKSTIVELN